MNFTKQQFKSELKDYAVITLGSVVYALAWTFFLLPYHIVSGGVTGLSAIVFYATGIPLQYTYFGINAILLVFALKIIGFRFMTKTIYATFMLSFMLSFTQTLVADENGNLIKLMGEGNDFMSLLIGSIMLGVALAVVVFAFHVGRLGWNMRSACRFPTEAVRAERISSPLVSTNTNPFRSDAYSSPLTCASSEAVFSSLPSANSSSAHRWWCSDFARWWS